MKTFGRWISSTLLIFMLAAMAACEKPTEANKQQNDNPALSLTVYKNAQCKCCGKWVSHMQRAGFHINVSEPKNLNAIKDRYGIEPTYRSCHTAVERDTGYVFEGHIPAPVVQRFLKEKPAGAKGLSVPGI